INQVIEREVDGRMQRTRRRPIPGQRMGVVEATAVGMVCILGGAAYLAITTNVVTGILSVLTASAYLGVYTPLKMRSPICTTIGDVAGALIVLLAFLVFSIRFARVLSGLPAGESGNLARGLLRASVLYLPALFALMMINSRFTR